MLTNKMWELFGRLASERYFLSEGDAATLLGNGWEDLPVVVHRNQGRDVIRLHQLEAYKNKSLAEHDYIRDVSTWPEDIEAMIIGKMPPHAWQIRDKQWAVGDVVNCNGYRGVVQSRYSRGMVIVRIESGEVCVSDSDILEYVGLQVGDMVRHTGYQNKGHIKHFYVRGMRGKVEVDFGALYRGCIVEVEDLHKAH